MTDRELLELAAKAAGALACWSSTLDEWQKDLTDPYVGGKKWNPLTDDGDALRLAVKLKIHVQPDTRYCWASTFRVNATEETGADPYEATRRAIVRAAAEIGKAMK